MSDLLPRLSTGRSLPAGLGMAQEATTVSALLRGFLLLLLVVASSCAASRELAVTETPHGIEPALARPLRVHGYVTRGDVLHRFDGLVRSVGLDSLEFFAEGRQGTRLQKEKSEVRFRVARSEVKALQVHAADKAFAITMGILLVLGLGALVGVGLTELGK